MGEILKITKDKVTIRNASSNRKKTIEISKALAIPPVGSFVKSVTGKWHKVMVTEGRGASLAAVQVLPNEKGKGRCSYVFCDLYLCCETFICVLKHSFVLLVLHRQRREGGQR